MYFNEAKSHKKSKQSDSALEKYCVTQCDCQKLGATFAIGIIITNLW